MTLDEMEAILKPFADFTAVFEHNLGGVPNRGETFYTKAFSVQGNDMIAAINVDDFYKLKDAYGFVKGLPRPVTEPVLDKAGVTDEVEGEVRKAKPEDVKHAEAIPQSAAGQPMPELNDTKKHKGK